MSLHIYSRQTYRLVRDEYRGKAFHRTDLHMRARGLGTNGFGSPCAQTVDDGRTVGGIETYVARMRLISRVLTAKGRTVVDRAERRWRREFGKNGQSFGRHEDGQKLRALSGRCVKD